MSDCSLSHNCKNEPTSCSRCRNQSLFKAIKKQSKTPTKIFHDKKTMNASDSWKDLETKVMNELNNVPTIEQARRTLASGALWFDKSDITDAILRVECKERSGEKSFSIQKEWLDKITFETKTDQIPCLAFRFKNDVNIYNALNQKDLIELVNLIKILESDNHKLKLENEILKGR